MRTRAREFYLNADRFEMLCKHYKFNDKKWMKNRHINQGYDKPLNIYEVHLGSWRKYQDGSSFNYADIAIVSSANKKAVIEEWERCELLPFTNYTMTQEEGTKHECIKKLLELGYTPNNVIMLGDSIEDLKAANANNVHYFAIRPKEEIESWQDFKNDAFNKFLKGEYKHG